MEPARMGAPSPDEVGEKTTEDERVEKSDRKSRRKKRGRTGKKKTIELSPAVIKDAHYDFMMKSGKQFKEHLSNIINEAENKWNNMTDKEKEPYFIEAARFKAQDESQGEADGMKAKNMDEEKEGSVKEED